MDLLAEEPRTTADGDAGRHPSSGRGRAGRKELLLALLGFAVLGALAYWTHFRHGGFYSDDWVDVASTLHRSSGGASATLNYYSELFPYRPGLIIYVPLKYWVLGESIAAQLALAVALAAVVSWLVYAILRKFAVPPVHAWMIGALALIFPWADSTKLWEAASLPSVAMIFALAGLWIALVGLERRSWRLHLVAAPLFLVSILTYEITLPLIAAMGILYGIRAGWKQTWRLWALDLAVVVAAGLWNRAHTNREVSSLSGDLHHAGEIVKNSGTVLGRTLWPLGPHGHTTAMLLVLLVVLGAGLAAFLADRDRWRGSGGWGLREWLLLGAAGLVIAALGWCMFIPANPYYTPSGIGDLNRVTAVACFGLLMTVYAAIGIGVTLVAGFLPGGRWARYAWLAPPALAILLGATYVHVLDRHIHIWDDAYKNQVAAFENVERADPDPADGTVFYLAGTPAFQAPGVPIFEAEWTFGGMVKTRYANDALNGYSTTPSLSFACAPTGVELVGSAATPPPMTPYGNAVLVNAGSGIHARPQDRAACEKVIGEYGQGPAELTSGY